MVVRTHSNASEFGTGAGPQFTETAEDNIWIIIFYDSNSAAWDVGQLTVSDDDEPYLFTAASVTAAGPTIDAALRTAINADSTVIAMLVDSSADGIDIANLTYDDTPPALEIGATATLPSLTASGGAELVDPVPIEVGGSATLPGLTATGGVELTDVAALEIGGTVTLPGLTATGGVELSTVAPLEIGGTATLPSLTGEGGVELVDAVPLEMAYTIGDVLRLDSITDLDTLFLRASTDNDQGAWVVQSTGGTSSSNTGPGTNSSGPYLFTESSSSSATDLESNSVVTILTAIMATWTGTGRQMALRASIAGLGTFDTDGGMMVEGRADNGDPWTEIDLLEGWGYSNTYVAGESLTDWAGDTQAIAQDGGWVDFVLNIPDTVTEVRIRIAPGSGSAFRHDMALWNVQLIAGTAAALQVGGAATLPSLTGEGGVMLVAGLALSDFNATDLELVALANITVGAPPEIYGTGLFGVATPGRPISGTLNEGEIDIADVAEPVSRLRFRDSGSAAGGQRISLNDDGGLDQNVYWGAGGDGNDLTLYLQRDATTDGLISFPIAGQIAASGGNYVIFDVPSEHQDFVAGVHEGDIINFGFARPSAAPPLEVGGEATLPGLTGEGGVSFSDAAPLEVGATATLPGLTATGGVELTDVAALEIGGAATLPRLTATGGVELTDAAALEVGGAATLPSLTGEGGVMLAFPPMATAVDTAVEVGDTLRVTLAETTELTGSITYSMSNLPAGATFTPATRLLEWTPTGDAARMVTYTATDGTDSDVKRFLLMAHESNQPRYALLVDWDGDKSFSHPLSDAFGDLTKGGVRTSRGRNYASMIYGRSMAGTLEATLVNFDGDYDRFATSDLSGLLLPRRRIIFVLAADSVAYRLWTGFLDEVRKVERTGGNDVVRVRATDIIGDLARADCGVAYMATTTIPNAVTAVLDAAGIDADDRGAIAGTTQIEDYFAPDAKALLHLRHLEETEAGFLLVTGAGKVTFESVNTRNTRMRSRQAQATITDADTYTADDLLIIPPPKQHDPMKDIANIVTVRVRRWSEASETELWRLGETVELQAGDVVRFQVSAGDSSQGRDPVTGRYSGQRDQAVAEWIEPAANTDYTANTQAGGGGADRTSSVGREFAGAGTSAMLAVENEHASDAIHVRLLKVRGQLLEEEEPIVLELRDEDSIADYGPRPYTVASELLSSVIEAQTYGQYILTLYAQPTRKAEVKTEVSDQLDYAGTLELSDRLEYVSRGIGTDMYIESIGHVLRPGFRHDMRLTLSQAGAFDDVIILDTGPGLDTGILGA